MTPELIALIRALALLMVAALALYVRNEVRR